MKVKKNNIKLDVLNLTSDQRPVELGIITVVNWIRNS
jgi:hypothetical protein